VGCLAKRWKLLTNLEEFDVIILQPRIVEQQDAT
jgi:hypothetical protein